MPRGSTLPGPLSAAMAAYMDRLMRDKAVSRDAVAKKAGIATGRVSALLNGHKPWYLEDVERFSAALEVDALDVLEQFARVVALPLPEPGEGSAHPALPSVTRWADTERLAALKAGTEPGSETDDGQTP